MALLLEPLDLIARVCALVPPPRVHMVAQRGTVVPPEEHGNPEGHVSASANPLATGGSSRYCSSMLFDRLKRHTSTALVTLLCAYGPTTSAPTSSSAASALAPVSAVASVSTSAAPLLPPTATASGLDPGMGLRGIGESGGCPCGCDHSEAMAAELTTRGGDAARDQIERTLKTIAVREDEGYITEAMVEHRLRMLSLLRTPHKGKAIAIPAGFITTSTDRGVALEPASAFLPAHTPVVEHAGLRARAVLTAHGEATELVNGREKPLRASFRIGIEIENLGTRKVTLGQPTIEGDAGYPVSRWYEVGGDGRRWEGSIAAGERKRVNIIGYLAEHVKPGAALDARVRLQGLVLETRTLARRHWNKPE